MGPAERPAIHEQVVVTAKTATIIEKEQKALDMEILATFLIGIPKPLYDKMVAAVVEGKTEMWEVQKLSEQMELAASLAAANNSVLQINKNVAAVTQNALKTLEEKVAALTGGGVRKNAL